MIRRVLDQVSHAHSLRATASEVVARLAEDPGIDAVLLYGSVARGDATAHSDIDLLVIGADSGQTVAMLRKRVEPVDPERRAGFVFHTRESFANLTEDGSRFVVHLRVEGEVLLERTGQLTAFLSAPWRPISVEQEIHVELARLANYDRVQMFGGRFLFALAHVFSIGKAIVMARLADEGHFEFNRRKALAEFAHRHPQLADDVRVVAELEPFRDWTQRQNSTLPFEPSGAIASERLVTAVAAVRRLSGLHR